ncbi:MAG: ABC transporter ATP-binding protein/permease [Defluviitaleaceae bacterium]|nr:ABC transporter ATP-binding protein/permease [Defluviitaleaceae bacterium]
MWIWFFRKISFSSGLSGAVGALAGGLVYMFIGLRALYGMYGIGSVVQYVGAVTNLINAFSGITNQIGSIAVNLPYMQNVHEFLSLPAPDDSGVKATAIEKHEIEFENVSFKYEGSDEYALKNVSLKFTPGKRLAVVGMNGSGKTTMVKLLCRLYEPTEGIIRLNGADVREYARAAYSRLFNVVFQDYKLFSLPIGENVAAALGYDKTAAAAALASAGFGEKLESLQNGLDTMVGKDCDKNGTLFSGGENQKMAIARAIYKGAPFAVFDEPTAALDPISEYEIYTRLNEIIGDKTAVFISHRLSSCRFCDEIAVFHEGRVAQTGSHEKLLAEEGGRYAKLWAAQAVHYADAEGPVETS